MIFAQDFNDKEKYYSLDAIKDQVNLNVLPTTIKILLENVLRNDENEKEHLIFNEWNKQRKVVGEVNFFPARVLMQDYTGVPAIVDLATMRDAMNTLGKDPNQINPIINVDLVIDHSVQVDEFGSGEAMARNNALEMQRNRERYQFLRWGQGAFSNFRVVPPGTGICHQVNLEYLAKVVWQKDEFLYPDTVVGTDSHTTMVNSLGVLGWGVGGIEAESAMLGKPLSMLIPEVVGVKLLGRLSAGVMATDLTLHITHVLRKKGVVGKFVEYFGPGLQSLTLADRATIANMSPEYGATCGFFPIDQETLRYLRLTGRDEEKIALVERYAKLQGLWHDEERFAQILYTDLIEIDLSKIEHSLAGPKRPQDRVSLSSLRDSFLESFATFDKATEVEGKDYKLRNGDVVLAAITSCTNTSNPAVLVGAGLMARRAKKLGLQVKPWVKTSFAPGSQVVSQYLQESNLQEDLNYLGFNVVGYGCTTCIGNSGPLSPELVRAIQNQDLAVAGVLSGNRNFEGRINPHVRANYLASPLFVVLYALAGTIDIDLGIEPVTHDEKGVPVFMKDLWPTDEEIAEVVRKYVKRESFIDRYRAVFTGDERWQKLGASEISQVYDWDESSIYIRRAPFFAGIERGARKLENVHNSRILAIFGDSITTDHISPAGSIKADSPAGLYLQERGIMPQDFNSYGAQRGNHEVMMRGTFANIRLKNKLMKGVEGGYTMVNGKQMSIYDAAMHYKAQNIPTVILAGREYGTGSSRDWAAKGTLLLGIKAVIAESFERIHRSNLVGMGVWPLVFADPDSFHEINFTGEEKIDIIGLDGKIQPKMPAQLIVKDQDGKALHNLELICAISTLEEVNYLQSGSILHSFLLES